MYVTAPAEDLEKSTGQALLTWPPYPLQTPAHKHTLTSQ